MIQKHVIETVTGKFVDMLDPQVETIDVQDIAWGLSREPRFAGQTQTTLPYSVAQHSMVVANFMSRLFIKNDPLRVNAIAYFKANDIPDAITTLEVFGQAPKVFVKGALFHDASEAYLRDIPTPIKNLPGLKQEYEKIEHRLTAVINRRLFLDIDPLFIELQQQYQHLLHFVDVYARVIEAYHMMVSRGLSWGSDIVPHPSDVNKFQSPMTGVEAHERFLTAAQGFR